MRDTIIMEVNGQRSLDIQTRLWVRLICECDLYAKIYGKLDCKDAYDLVGLFVIGTTSESTDRG